MRGDTPPPGAPYRVGEPIELRVAGSRSGTPGGDGNGSNRTELERKRKRSGSESDADDVRE